MPHPPLHLTDQGLIPPGSTTFHLLLAVHIAATLTCVVTGAIAALSPSAPAATPPGHPLLPIPDRGGCLCGLAGRPALAPGRLPAGPRHPVVCRRHPRPHRPASPVAMAAPGRAAPCRHERLPHPAGDRLPRRQRQDLPVWRSLPHLAYWLLPSAVGLPWSLAPSTASRTARSLVGSCPRTAGDGWPRPGGGGRAGVGGLRCEHPR
jgi:hypothetical protein